LSFIKGPPSGAVPKVAGRDCHDEGLPPAAGPRGGLGRPRRQKAAQTVASIRKGASS
jgi:hypothetical protein